MQADRKRMKAIDLYAGAGGWSAGLAMAGIDVVASYELWPVASRTNELNSGHNVVTADIRSMDISCLPTGIDVVVGSPPCTQFSFSNRGGGGDLSDGLRDIVRFFEIIQKVRPRYWIMENVPRVEKIVRREFAAGGVLHQFSSLLPKFAVVNMAEFGVPQRRKRCIVSNIDLDLLASYRSELPTFTLGDVINALTKETIKDPLYSITLNAADVTDQSPEVCLDEEEERINRTAKEGHPVYNSMAFPDPLDKTVRTVTATCTRVSRESIVIESPEQPGKFRRLTIRERACLQGFPINFQFFGLTHGQKAKMVGNAVPPPFAYYVAKAMQGIPASELIPIGQLQEPFKGAAFKAAETKPDRAGRTYKADRRFRFAIPSLRLKSGVRFELVNAFENGCASWQINFIYGDSKDIRTLELNSSLKWQALKGLEADTRASILGICSEVSNEIKVFDCALMQKSWIRAFEASHSPFKLLDILDIRGQMMIAILRECEPLVQQIVAACVASQTRNLDKPLSGFEKLRRNAPLILAGIILGATTNEIFDLGIEIEAGRRMTA